MNTKFKLEVAGTTVYMLESDGFRRGVEQFRNRFSANVQGYGSTPKEELEEIATLMAAAPELLEALQMIIAACDACGKDDDKSLIDEFTQKMEDKARAAIAKATGQK